MSMPKVPSVLTRGVRRGLANVRRERGWGTAVGSLFGVLLLGQLLLMLVFGVQAGINMLREQTDLRLEILESATDSQIQDLFQNIRTLPYVEDAVYVTREQAYEREKLRDPQLIEFLSKFGIENPFPETMGVRLKNLEDYPAFVEFIRQPVFTKVVNPAFLSQTTDQEQQVVRLTDVVSAARAALIVIVGVLIVVMLFVVVELVRRRVAAKREEILVEELVGADRMAIVLPFATEMCCLLGIALLLSIICTGIVAWVLPMVVPALASGGMFGVWTAATRSLSIVALPWVLLIEIAIVIGLSFVGSMIALRPAAQKEDVPWFAFA